MSSDIHSSKASSSDAEVGTLLYSSLYLLAKLLAISALLDKPSIVLGTGLLADSNLRSSFHKSLL